MRLRVLHSPAERHRPLHPQCPRPEVKRAVGSRAAADWSETYYQYTNRLAHLYFLRNLNRIPAHLVFVYLLNDATMQGPKTAEEWAGAIRLSHAQLGIDESRLTKAFGAAVIDVFIDDSPTLRAFVGIDLGQEPVPDETTVCKCRHLLEEHGLGRVLFDEVTQHLRAQGLAVSTGTIVDATIIAAPSSTKGLLRLVLIPRLSVDGRVAAPTGVTHTSRA